ncbi:MAG: hypothetical protein RLZZ584_1353 [Pseudomonadota bacterium]|jgi:diguanylate cyclase (GGDEF)-like protein/PAS domain S-box-containing protein
MISPTEFAVPLLSLLIGIALATLAGRRRRDAAIDGDGAAAPAAQVMTAEQELARDRELFAHGPVVMLRTRLLDAGLQLLYVSDNVRELWGYTPEQVTALDDGLALFHADDRDALRLRLADARAHDEATLRFEARVRLPNGDCRWHKYHDMMDPLSHDRRGYLIDIDERKQAELLSTQKETQLQAMVSELRTAQREGLVLQEASDMLHSTEDLTEAFEIIRLAAERLFAGWSGWIASAQGSELVVGAHWGESHHLPAHGFETRDCWALRRGKTHMYIDSSESVCCAHLAHLTPDERWPYLCMPMAAHGETVGSLHLYTNELVTESELHAVQARASRFAETLKLALSNLKLRASLQEQAMRDALTGLYNRRYLDESLVAELHRARRTSSPLSVAMLDVDHFKRFNDSWGHEAGDLVLQAVAQLLQAQLRSYDLACRYGGEEMAVVMPGCTAADARMRLEQIRIAVSQLRLDYKGRQLPAVTVSIGLTDAGNHVAENVLRRADVALYEAKRGGRNRLVVASRDTASAVPVVNDATPALQGAEVA